MTNYINNCRNKRIQVVKAYEIEKISKNRKPLFKDANS